MIDQFFYSLMVTTKNLLRKNESAFEIHEINAISYE